MPGLPPGRVTFFACPTGTADSAPRSPSGPASAEVEPPALWLRLEQAARSARGRLFTDAKRIVIDEWRTARSRRERVTEQLPERPVADGVDRTLDRQLVVAALRTLSAEHREVLVECYFRGASVAE